MFLKCHFISEHLLDTLDPAMLQFFLNSTESKVEVHCFGCYLVSGESVLNPCFANCHETTKKIFFGLLLNSAKHCSKMKLRLRLLSGVSKRGTIRQLSHTQTVMQDMTSRTFNRRSASMRSLVSFMVSSMVLHFVELLGVAHQNRRAATLKLVKPICDGRH